MKLIRIGDKLIDRDKVDRVIDKIFKLRASGMSQLDVAAKVGIDRTFVSRLETLGEVRKGGKIALIGFPVGNKEELAAVASQEGIDYVLLMNDEERWKFLEGKSGVEAFNAIMGIIFALGEYDAVIFLGSDMRIRLAESILGDKVIGIEIGESPIKGDRYVDPEIIRSTVRGLQDRGS